MGDWKGTLWHSLDWREFAEHSYVLLLSWMLGLEGLFEPISISCRTALGRTGKSTLRFSCPSHLIYEPSYTNRRDLEMSSHPYEMSMNTYRAAIFREAIMNETQPHLALAKGSLRPRFVAKLRRQQP